MSKLNIQASELAALFIGNTPLIDVRAPIEFAEGHLPGAVNLPILNDDERSVIGATYRQKGNSAATELGHYLVSGSVKEERVQAWQRQIEAHPDTIIYCFRGGQRSKITQRWLKDVGIERPLIEGGYKLARNFLTSVISDFSQTRNLWVISGATGSGKTRFLDDVQKNYATIPLENLAHHRGSAFGSMRTPQPRQVDFENQLAVVLLKLQAGNYPALPFLVEDESRLIGRCVVPDDLFKKLRESEVLWIEERLEVRVENILQEYVVQALTADEPPQELFARYKKSLRSITRKLGGSRTQEIMGLLEVAELDFLATGQVEKSREWIEKLLSYYYDPLYLGSLDRRQVKISFRGSEAECRQFLQQASLRHDR